MGSSIELGDPKAHYQRCEGCRPQDKSCPIGKFLEEFDRLNTQKKSIRDIAGNSGLTFREAHTPIETADEDGPYEVYTCPVGKGKSLQGEVKVYLAPPTIVTKWKRSINTDYFPIDLDQEN